ncbi:MAG: hypothetical protein AB7S26_04470 [Sandaracinaceae bacterium]
MGKSNPAQTPGIWTLNPGDKGYDAACKAALKACGVDPDAFGTYKSRLKAQQDARAQCKAEGITPSKLKKEDAGTFCTANSQSGHMAQNAMFQSAGARADDCGNIAPNPFGDPKAGSSFGYSCEGAPCVDHYGKSTLGGTCHGEVSRVVEGNQGWADRGAVAGEPVPMGDPARKGGPTMEDQVRASARVHVDANREHNAGPAPSDNPTKVAQLNNAQQMNADRMLGDDPKSKALAAQGATKGKKPAGASGPGPSDEIKNFAAECEVTKWKAAMTQMRADAINNSPMGKAAQAKYGKPFTECTQKQQKALVEEQAAQFGKPPPNPPKSPKGLATPPNEGARGDPKGTPPTEQDCRDYQGNYLAWQQANNHSGKNPSASKPGPLPPWSGRAPKGADPSAPPPGPSGGSGGSR